MIGLGQLMPNNRGKIHRKACDDDIVHGFSGEDEGRVFGVFGNEGEAYAHLMIYKL